MFRIQVKEKAVEDLLYEIKGLQEKNKRHQARVTEFAMVYFVLCL